MGPIDFDSLGQELSRNVFVVSVYAFETKIDRSEDFFGDTEKVEISMESRLFSKMPRKLPGSFSDVWAVPGSVLECVVNYFRMPKLE